MSNPLQLVYSALRTLPEGHPRFRELVRVGNRIGFDDQDDRDPLKSVVADADLPEAVLEVQTAMVKMHSTSSTSSMTQQFAWLISTGDQRVTDRLLEVEWTIFVGMLDWQRVLGALRWHGKSFCKRTDIVSCSAGLSDPARNRGIKGWSAIWRCEVEMHFATKDLLEELVPESSSSSSSSGS